MAVGMLGGALIGLAAALLLLTLGQVAGVSGVVGRFFMPKESGEGPKGWRVAFVAGLLGGGWIFSSIFPGSLGVPMAPEGLPLMAAGLLVGVGTQWGGGCTSGHGVCGVARGSLRSMVATAVFMGVAMAVVFVMRHVLHQGGAA